MGDFRLEQLFERRMESIHTAINADSDVCFAHAIQKNRDASGAQIGGPEIKCLQDIVLLTAGMR